MADDMLQMALLLDEEDLFLLAAILFEEEEEQNNYERIRLFRLNFNQLATTECFQMFRFYKDDLVQLRELLRIPEHIKLPNQSTFTGIDALCVTLHRLSYPCRLKDLRKIFGRSKSDLSRIVAWTCKHILDNFEHLINSLHQPWLTSQDLQEMADCIQQKGCPLDKCWGFIDGTVVQICRPEFNQRDLYSGHKRVHCLKFQSVVTPNGLIASLMGPFLGRRHDAGIFHESRIQEQLQQKTDVNGNLYYLYGDAAYPLIPSIITPYKGANISPEQHNFNAVMSPMRVCVEWSFADIVRTFAFIDYHKNLKLYLQPLANLYKVAAILVNCRACLYRNQTSTYFGLQPPSLQDYLA